MKTLCNPNTSSPRQRHGHLYILSNPSLRRGYLKVGLAAGSVDIRASQLSRSTSIPQPFEVRFTVPVADVHIAERRVHLLLDDYRVNSSKEFFQLDIRKAKTACRSIAAFENENSFITDKIFLAHSLLAARYGPGINLTSRKIIYALMSATTNNNFFDQLLGARRGLIDGFVSAAQIATYLNIEQRSASIAMKKLAHAGPSVACTPIESPQIHRVFDFIRYHKCQLGWRFSPAFREHFYTEKL